MPNRFDGLLSQPEMVILTRLLSDAARRWNYIQTITPDSPWPSESAAVATTLHNEIVAAAVAIGSDCHIRLRLSQKALARLDKLAFTTSRSAVLDSMFEKIDDCEMDPRTA